MLKTIINRPFGNGLYHMVYTTWFMVITGGWFVIVLPTLVSSRLTVSTAPSIIIGCRSRPPNAACPWLLLAPSVLQNLQRSSGKNLDLGLSTGCSPICGDSHVLTAGVWLHKAACWPSQCCLCLEGVLRLRVPLLDVTVAGPSGTNI